MAGVRSVEGRPCVSCSSVRTPTFAMAVRSDGKLFSDRTCHVHSVTVAFSAPSRFTCSFSCLRSHTHRRIVQARRREAHPCSQSDLAAYELRDAIIRSTTL